MRIYSLIIIEFEIIKEKKKIRKRKPKTETSTDWCYVSFAEFRSTGRYQRNNKNSKGTSRVRTRDDVHVLFWHFYS